jgi:predicted membrane channel-forming protein YqfA (hemolysin III family)
MFRYVLLSVVFPVVWWLMVALRYGFGAQAVVQEFYLGMALCYAGYGAGIFFYLTRFPERLFPGRFDLLPSHTFWHLGVLAGAALLLKSFVQIALAIGDKPCEVLLNSTWFN